MKQIPNTRVTRATQYRAAGDRRLEEAEFLKTFSTTGAFYLAGYTIECYIKWAMCNREGVSKLQDLNDDQIIQHLVSSRGHDLEFLFECSGYERHIAANPMLKLAVTKVCQWKHSLRYIADHDIGAKELSQLFSAINLLRRDLVSWANS